MAITFDYNTWDSDGETVPQKELSLGNSTTPVDTPFDDFLSDILVQNTVFGYAPGNNEFDEALDKVVAGIWISLAWCRRNNVTATKLERLVKNYTNKPRSPHQTKIDAVKAQTNVEEYANAYGLTVGTQDPENKGGG